MHLTCAVFCSVELDSLVEKLGSVDISLKHVLAFLQTELALIADIPKTVVVVEAALANPVTALFLNVSWHALYVVSDPVESLLSFVGELDSSFLTGWEGHVLRFTFSVLSTLGLLASVAVLTALEVIVLALGAFPTAIGELEVVLHHLGRHPRLSGVHGHEHVALMGLDIIRFKIVDFLGKLRHACCGYKWCGLLI